MRRPTLDGLAGRDVSPSLPTAFARSSLEDRAPRDIFPIPVPVVSRYDGIKLLARSSHRRILRPEHLSAEAALTVRCLNAQFCGTGSLAPGSGRSTPGGVASSGQLKCIQHITDSVSSLGPPPANMTGPGALTELRAASAYSSDCQLGGILASYDPKLLSLPDSTNIPVSLDKLWGVDGQIVVE